MKIESLKCANCDSENVKISIDGELYDKNLFPIKKLEELIKHYIKEGDYDFCICECHGDCRDEVSVDIIMDNKNEYYHAVDYKYKGNWLNTIEACLMELVGIEIER